MTWLSLTQISRKAIWPSIMKNSSQRWTLTKSKKWLQNRSVWLILKVGEAIQAQWQLWWFKNLSIKIQTKLLFKQLVWTQTSKANCLWLHLDSTKVTKPEVIQETQASKVGVPQCHLKFLETRIWSTQKHLSTLSTRVKEMVQGIQRWLKSH